MTKRAKKPRAPKPRAVIPSEDWESKKFVNYLEWQRELGNVVLFSHLPLETRSKAQRIKNHALGTRAGVPDYVVVLPGGRVVWVEMKRIKGGRVSPEQRVWLSALGVHACVAHGADEAVAFMSSFFLTSQKLTIETITRGC